MRYPASEKLEIIRLIEQSHLPTKQTIDRLGIPRTTFYRWYDRYLTGGAEALEDRSAFAERLNGCFSGRLLSGMVMSFAIERKAMPNAEDNIRYLVTATEIASEKGLAKMHFLNPNAQRINKSLGDLTGLTGFGFHIIEVQPGRETTEHHVHHHEDECVYVLQGNATALIGDNAVEIGPGDFLGYRKGGVAHSIKNTGSETLRCIVVGERLAHDVGDYPNKGKRIFRNTGLPWNLVDHDTLEEPQAGAKN